MTTFDFSPFYRSLIGFDQLAPSFENAARLGDPGFPPYDIEKVGSDRYRITMAVAGFDLDHLAIEQRENTLLVEGRHPEDGDQREYLHRGIARRHFSRSFQLADYVKVKDARLDKGLLYIDLERELPEEMKPRKIEIGKGAPRRLLDRFTKVVEGKGEAA